MPGSVIRQIIKPDGIVYIDSFASYDTLDVPEHHLRRFNGIPQQRFHPFLKECE